MQTVKASVILDDAYRLMRWDQDQLEESEQGDARAAFSQTLQETWEAWWWTWLMLSEQRTYAPEYANATAYVVEDIVYFPPTQKYYQCVADSQGFDPENLNSSNAYVPDLTHWVEAKISYTGADYNGSLTYAQGDVARYATDGNYYSYLGDGLILTAAGSSDVNGTYQRSRPYNDKPSYRRTTSAAFALDIVWDLTVGWRLYGTGGEEYQSLEDVPTPDLVTTWTPVNTGVAPGPTIAVYNTAAPADNDFWGLLTPFTPGIAEEQDGESPMGSVRSVSALEAPTTRNPGLIEFAETDDGVRVFDPAPAKRWVYFRRITPVVTGDEFDTAATYEATATNDLVFDA